MGYRSDVTIAFYTRHNKETTFPLLKLWFDENYPKHDFCEVEMGDDYVLVRYEGVKWYEGYPEVAAAARAVDLFVETFKTSDNDTFAYETIRVGEDVADIEESASAYCDYRLGVNRSIYFN